jgi:predicted Zn-dependent protease
VPALERSVALGKAVEALERVAPMDEASSEVMTLYGRALLRNDQPDEAERVLQHATRRYPVDPAAFLAYASVAERQNHLAEARGALIEYGTLVAEEPDFAARARHIGTLSMRLKDPATAATWFERAASGRPGDMGLLVDLAEAQLATGRTSEAAATVERGLERSPDNARLVALAARARRDPSVTTASDR